jgi:hypothetical protein
VAAEERLILTTGLANAELVPVEKVRINEVYVPTPPNVADVLLMPATCWTIVVVAPGENWTTPCTSQSPAVKLMLVALAGTPVVKPVFEVELL